MEKYTITDCLYKANGREVLLVTDKETENCLVIKKIRVNQMKDTEQAETIKEVQALLRLRHRHIVSIISSFKEEATRTINIVMPYYLGGDLFEWIEKHREVRKSFATAVIVMILRQLCEALAYIHSQHILHRDIKPRNIFVENDRTVKLGDFGIAKILESTLEYAITHNIGTFPYTAPEMFSKESYREKCDIWSLGCVLYEMITLEQPFQATVWHELIKQISNDPYPPLPWLTDRNLADLIAELLDKDPSVRPNAQQILARQFVVPDVVESSWIGPGMHTLQMNISGEEPAQAIKYPNMIPEYATRAAIADQLMDTDDGYTPIPYYRMEAVPRGYCVIIDNQKFTSDPADPKAIQYLGDRAGSEKDSAALRNSFERLQFIVALKINLTDVEIVQFLKNISAADHTNYDCFVCCILSHGEANHVFGVNGRTVQLSTITSMFRAPLCPSLARKPKLFFMASSRGKGPGRAVQEPEPQIKTDGPEIDFDSAEWVPNEADFLVGYATVTHVLYRNRYQGTFYINELTKVLDKYAHREDLQTLLVRVNAAVSNRIPSGNASSLFRAYKQTPAPQHTLTKQLKSL